MKKSLLLIACTAFAGLASAQRSAVEAVAVDRTFRTTLSHATAARGTGINDTIVRANFGSGDTAALYFTDAAPFDSGFSSGHNGFGDRAFAERFEINPSDSSVQIIGVAAYLVGQASASTSRTFFFKSWRQGNPLKVTGTAKTYIGGYPSAAAIDSVSVPMASIRDASTGMIDTVLLRFFTRPLASIPKIADSFFVGVDLGPYTWSALAGDTLNVVLSRDLNRNSPIFFVKSNGDTILNVQNCTQFSNGVWGDNFFQNSPSLRTNYFVYAIVRVAAPLGTGGVTRNNLTYHGTFPNPASGDAKLRFSLKAGSSVTIELMDMTGRRLKTEVANQQYSAGEHTMPLSIAELPAGQYVYLISTADGDGIGGQFSVVK